MKLKSSLIASAILCATSSNAFAADLTVNYAPAVSAVPSLTEWAMIILALGLVTAALILIRRRRVGPGVAFSIAALAAAATVGNAGDALAAARLLNLSGGGSQSLILSGDVRDTVTVTNTSGVTVRLTSFVFSNNAPDYGVNSGPPNTCVVGGLLAAGESCTLVVEVPM